MGVPSYTTAAVCYLPMPEGQADLVQDWLEGAGERWDIVPVLLRVPDWNADLTPWPSPPVFKKGKAFGGRAGDYLARLETEIIPSVEAQRNLVPRERWLAGISLSGMFALWAAAKSDRFTRVAAVSGSFWYPGFVDWLSGQTLQARSVYLSLGDREAEGRNPHLGTIADDTAAVVRMLREKGVPTTFEWTEGTHFGPVCPRLEKALQALSADLSGFGV